MIEEKAKDFCLLFCWISQDRLGFAATTTEYLNLSKYLNLSNILDDMTSKKPQRFL